MGGNLKLYMCMFCQAEKTDNDVKMIYDGSFYGVIDD